MREPRRNSGGAGRNSGGAKGEARTPTPSRRASSRRRRARAGTDAAFAAVRPADTGRQVDMGKMHGYLGYLLRRAQMLAYADFIAELADLNLSPGQFGVLTVIATNPGLRQSEVSAALGIQKTNFVAVLNEFERRGLAERRAAGDRRSYALYLTAAGKALLRRARAAQARHEARLVEPLGPGGRAQLISLLAKLTRVG
ncbi:MAG TPA: MarR family transcriptional regulator [Steroidobacteraceae bacterium]|nr:MarR family transcriptional regulator [Steroidobacteraceae bacterium]